MAERFASVSEEESKVLIENKDSKNTKRTTKIIVKILNDYLREKNHKIKPLCKLFEKCII